MGILYFPDRNTAEFALMYIESDYKFGLSMYQYPVIVSDDNDDLLQLARDCQFEEDKQILFLEDSTLQTYILEESAEDWLSRFDYISIEDLKNDISADHPEVLPLFDGKLRVTADSNRDVIRVVYYMLTQRCLSSVMYYPTTVSLHPEPLNL